MPEIIAIIILISSALGMGLIVFRKIPELSELTEMPAVPKKEKKIFFGVKNRIRESDFFKPPFYKSFLEKVLFKIRIISLKTDNKTFDLIKKLRGESRTVKSSEDYWDEIKRAMMGAIRKKNSKDKNKNRE